MYAYLVISDLLPSNLHPRPHKLPGSMIPVPSILLPNLHSPLPLPLGQPNIKLTGTDSPPMI